LSLLLRLICNEDGPVICCCCCRPILRLFDIEAFAVRIAGVDINDNNSSVDREVIAIMDL
jgi:hypothetical protein